MEAARNSETLVNLYQTTQRYDPEDSHLRTHRRENLKSYKVAELLLLYRATAHYEPWPFSRIFRQLFIPYVRFLLIYICTWFIVMRRNGPVCTETGKGIKDHSSINRKSIHTETSCHMLNCVNKLKRKQTLIAKAIVTSRGFAWSSHFLPLSSVSNTQDEQFWGEKPDTYFPIKRFRKL
jgi:hypothetical protein